MPEQTSALGSLLANAVDYAGLFPPSAIGMADAVVNYAAYKNSTMSWMLGRFVVTAARLDEFYDIARDLIARDAGKWPIAAVAGEDVQSSLKTIADFNANNVGAVCDAIEIKAGSSSDVERIARMIPAETEVYFEIALDATLPEMVSSIAIAGRYAKMRTGGITPDAFPTSDAIVRFVQACSAANVPFKATAGLHHPIRCFRPLTYEANSAEGTMHGFLNLFLMAGFAREGYRRDVLEEIMEDEVEDAFQFDQTGIRWRNDFVLTIWQIEQLRRSGIRSFGSCSFEEPIEDLRKLGIL